MGNRTEDEQRMNCAAKFLPAEMGTEDGEYVTVPAIEVEGAVVNVYVHDGRLRVSIALDAVTEYLLEDPVNDPHGLVKVDVFMNGFKLGFTGV